MIIISRNWNEKTQIFEKDTFQFNINIHTRFKVDTYSFRTITPIET